MINEYLKTNKPKKLHHGGAYNHKPVIRSSQSPNSAFNVNIGMKLDEEVQLKIMALAKFEQEVRKIQAQRLSKGLGGRIPAKVHKQIDQMKAEISAIRLESKYCKHELI